MLEKGIPFSAEYVSIPKIINLLIIFLEYTTPYRVKTGTVFVQKAKRPLSADWRNLMAFENQ